MLSPEEQGWVEKFQLYEKSVQNHEGDIEFINSEFDRIYGKEPLVLREDFGGTGLLSCGWVKQSNKHKAYAVDLDPRPIGYGKSVHFINLSPDAQKRMTYIEGNVLDNQNFKSDVIVAFNFSYFIFKKRSQLLTYFKKVREGLNSKGAFFIDLFGGTEACQPLVEETTHEDHTYFWDCDNFNPISNEVLYYIHFKVGKRKIDKAFVYDWRMWSLAELREILEEAGFSKTVAYWEGDDGEGGGDGNFYPADSAEACESWVTYIMALP